MRIRGRRLIAVAGWCGTRFVNALSATLRFDYTSVGAIPVDPMAAPSDRRFIYALWHENFLIPIVRLGDESVAALVSQHADGQMLGSLIRATGMGVVYGSTRRGGIAAVRQLLRDDVGHRHLAVTPDGPRGPRRQVQPGVVYLAARTGMQIVPIGIGYNNPWRVNSWDSFAIPRPFSRVRCLFGEPIFVQPKLGSSEQEIYQKSLQIELNKLSFAAESWANNDLLELPRKFNRSPLQEHVVQQSQRTIPVEVGVGRERGD
jgi:hypothetical protein